MLTSYSMVTKQYLLVLQFNYIAKGKVRYKSYTADMLGKWIKISETGFYGKNIFAEVNN